MSDELATLTSLLDSLGTLGALIVVIIAMFKGWIIPVSIQTKTDLLRDQSHKEIVEGYNKIIELQQTQIASLSGELEQMQRRNEQAVNMLSAYVDAQDTLAVLADKLKDKYNG